MKIYQKLSLGAVAALALAVPAYAQDPAPAATTMSAQVAPSPVSGTVLRYYVNLAGFVSAFDLQTADGVRLVTFSPSIAEKLNSMYPVGSTINGFWTSYTDHGVTKYHLAGATDKMPVPGAVMLPETVTDIDYLKSIPYTAPGAKLERFSGKITGYIADPKSKQLLALIMDGTTIIRVPQENRLEGPINAPEGITPIYSDSFVDGFAYPEIIRYGTVSPFTKRLIATGISVDGHALGTLGFGAVTKSKTGWKVNKDSAPEVEAKKWGYYSYSVAPAATN